MREPSLLHHPLKKRQVCTKSLTLIILLLRYALTQKYEKINVSAVIAAPVSPPCEICGIFCHIGVDC